MTDTPPELPPTRAQLHILRHSLGLKDDGSGCAYRNHFVTGPGSDDYDNCMALTASGLMKRHEGSPLTGGDPCFVVTEYGRNHAFHQTPMGG